MIAIQIYLQVEKFHFISQKKKKIYSRRNIRAMRSKYFLSSGNPNDFFECERSTLKEASDGSNDFCLERLCSRMLHESLVGPLENVPLFVSFTYLHVGHHDIAPTIAVAMERVAAQMDECGMHHTVPSGSQLGMDSEWGLVNVEKVVNINFVVCSMTIVAKLGASCGILNGGVNVP